jgi:hypothetical protein
MSKLETSRFKQNLLNGRVMAVKGNMPKNWRERVIEIAPEYDSLKGSIVMTNVFAGKSSDEKLTEIMERISSEFQLEQKAISRRKINALKRARISIPS